MPAQVNGYPGKSGESKGKPQPTHHGEIAHQDRQHRGKGGAGGKQGDVDGEIVAAIRYGDG